MVHVLIHKYDLCISNFWYSQRNNRKSRKENPLPPEFGGLDGSGAGDDVDDDALAVWEEVPKDMGSTTRSGSCNENFHISKLNSVKEYT